MIRFFRARTANKCGCGRVFRDISQKRSLGVSSGTAWTTRHRVQCFSGPMYSGKTSNFIQSLREVSAYDPSISKIIVCKSTVDTRWEGQGIQANIRRSGTSGVPKPPISGWQHSAHGWASNVARRIRLQGRSDSPSADRNGTGSYLITDEQSGQRLVQHLQRQQKSDDSDDVESPLSTSPDVPPWTTLVSRDGGRWHGVAPCTSDELLALLDLQYADESEAEHGDTDGDSHREKSYLVGNGTLLAIDEAQFFRADVLVSCVKQVLQRPGTRLLLSGLDLDFRGEEFGGLLRVQRYLEGQHGGSRNDGNFVRLTSKCSHGTDVRASGKGGCGASAPLTQRLASAATGTGNDGVIAIGDADMYQPACPEHHDPEPVLASHWFRESVASASRGDSDRRAQAEVQPAQAVQQASGSV